MRSAPVRSRSLTPVIAAVVLVMFGFGAAAVEAAPGSGPPILSGAPGFSDLQAARQPGAGQDEAPPPGADQPLDTTVDTQPSATVAPVQFNDYVKLGLLLMERKPNANEIPKPPPPPDPRPWRDAYKTGPNDGSPLVTPPPALGPGDGTVYAVGDSVLLGAEPYLQRAIGGWDLRLDARVSRRFPEGIDQLRLNRASIGQVVVVLLGHNYGGGGAGQYIDEVMTEAKKAQRVVLVTVTEWSPPQAEVNRAIYAAAQRYPNVVVAPWGETIRANPQFLWDHVHPNRAGAIALSNLIAVMIGPAPEVNGKKPPPPHLMDVPDVAPASSTTSSTRASSTTASASSTSSSSTTTTSTRPESTSTSKPVPP